MEIQHLQIRALKPILINVRFWFWGFNLFMLVLAANALVVAEYLTGGYQWSHMFNTKNHTTIAVKKSPDSNQRR